MKRKKKDKPRALIPSGKYTDNLPMESELDSPLNTFTSDSNEIIDFEDIKTQVEKTPNIPIDRKFFTDIDLFFPSKGEVKKIGEETLKNGDKIITYQKNRGRKKVIIKFFLPKGENPIIFSKYKQNVYLAGLLFAHSEKTLTPLVPIKDLRELLGRPEYLYKSKKLDDIVKDLVISYYEIKDKDGKNWEIGHLWEKAERRGEGKNIYYLVQINPEAGARVIQSFIKVDKEGRGFTSTYKTPGISYIQTPKEALKYKTDRPTRLLFYIMGLHFKNGSSYSVYLKTILRKMGITDKEVKSKSIVQLSKEIDRGLKKIKEEHFLWFIDKQSLDTLKEAKGKGYTNSLTPENINREGIVLIPNHFKKLRGLGATKKTIMLTKKDFLNLKIYFQDKRPKKHSGEKRKRKRKNKEYPKNFHIGYKGNKDYSNLTGEEV